MISIMPSPYPEEIAYGWFGRFHVLSGNISSTSTTKELFGVEKLYPSVHYPIHLNYFSEQLPKDYEFTAEYIINNHTMLPFFKPFLDDSELQKIIYNMKSGKRAYIKQYMGFEAGGVSKQNKIMICSDCLKEDIDKYQEIYIRRYHQISSNLICMEHGKYLYKYSIPENENEGIYVDINQHIKDFASINMEACTSLELLNLSKDIRLVIQGYLKNYNLNLLKVKYDEKLKVMKYKFPEGRVGQKKLINDFADFYSVDFLNMFHSNVDLEKRQSWIELLTHKSSRYIHPIRHLLFIKFLFGGIEEFVKFDEEYKPFGNAPWICLNPISEHYNQAIVQECSITKNCHTGDPMGHFKCVCGFQYSRRGPDKCYEDKHKLSRIECRGHIWEKYLKQLILDGQSIRKISKVMKCDKKVVIKYATKLNIVNQLNTNQNIKNNNIATALKEQQKLIIVYKQRIQDFIYENREVSRTDIRCALMKEYDLLRREEKQWLEKVLPKPRNINKKCTIIDWQSKDKEIRDEVIKVINDMLRGKELRRLTRHTISKKINYSGIRDTKTLMKIPLTKEVLELCSETREDFARRKITYMIEDMIKNGEEVQMQKINSKINIEQSKYLQFKSFVDEVATRLRKDMVRKYGEAEEN